MKAPKRLAIAAAVAAVAGWPLVVAAAPMGALFGADAETDQLIQIDPATGTGVAIGPLGFGVVGMAYDPVSDTLFGAGGRLLSINRLTGSATPVGGPTGFSISGLAVDPTTGEMFGVDSIADVLLSIDRTTGQASVIGPLGGGAAFANVTGLAFDQTGSVLYGVENGNDQLVIIDRQTGAATGVGSPFTVGGRVVTAIAFDPSTGELFGSDAAGVSISQLVAINPATGVGAPIGPMGFNLVEALAFAPRVPEPSAALIALVMAIVYKLTGVRFA